jgi:hypothetical protein
MVMDIAILLACAFMLIAPAMKMCWRKDHKDTSAEDSKKGKWHIFFFQGGFITIGIWFLHVFDVALDISYFLTADVRKTEIRNGLLVCIIIPFVAIPILVFTVYYPCYRRAHWEKEGKKACDENIRKDRCLTTPMLLCNCYVLKEKFAPEDEDEKEESHDMVLLVAVLFSLAEEIPQMIMQTMNNFLVGSTLSWSEVLSPITSYISTVSTFQALIYVLYTKAICSKEYNLPRKCKAGFTCLTFILCILPCTLVAWVPMNFTADTTSYMINQPSWVYENFDIIRVSEKAERDAVEAYLLS